MATRKAQRDHEASLRRQRARAKPHTQTQRDRNTIGANLCRAILYGHQQHRQSKQATGPT